MKRPAAATGAAVIASAAAPTSSWSGSGSPDGVRPTRNAAPPSRRRPRPQPRPHGNPRYHRACRGRPGLALNRPARAGPGQLLQLRRAREPGRLRHPQHRPGRAPAAGPQGQGPSQAARGDWAGHHRRRAGPSARSPRWRADERGADPLRHHLGVRLAEQPDTTTRLPVREGYAYTQRRAAFLVEPVAAVAFMMP
jgi:hypothetical protein